MNRKKKTKKGLIIGIFMIGIGAITGLILTSVNNVSQTELLARTHESLKVVVYEGEIAKCDDQSVECIKIGSGKSTEK